MNKNPELAESVSKILDTKGSTSTVEPESGGIVVEY